MDIYNYDKITGVFTGVSQADPSPLDPGAWLLPAYATIVAPPSTGEKEIAVCVDGAEWRIEEDHRGAKYWTPDKEEHTVKDLGPLPLNALNSACPSEYHFAKDGEWIYDEQKHREEWRKGAYLSRAEFAKQAVIKEWLTPKEAEEWAAGNTIPAIVLVAVEEAPEEKQSFYRIDAMARGDIGREDTLIVILAQKLAVSDDVLDDVFGFMLSG